MISRPSIAVQFLELRYAHHHHGRTGAIDKVQRRFSPTQKHLGAHLFHPPPELLMIEFIVPDVHPEFFHCRTGFEHDLIVPGVRFCLPSQHCQSGQEDSHPDALVRLAFKDGIIEVDRDGLCSRNTVSRDLATFITLRLLTSNGSFAVNIPVLSITNPSHQHTWYLLDPVPLATHFKSLSILPTIKHMSAVSTSNLAGWSVVSPE
jgi:hypothetical protein